VWTLTVLNPIDVTSSGCVGFLGPLDLIRLIVLVVGPSVISLGVRRDVGVAISNWIDLLLSKGAIWSSWVES